MRMRMCMLHVTYVMLHVVDHVYCMCMMLSMSCRVGAAVYEHACMYREWMVHEMCIVSSVHMYSSHDSVLLLSMCMIMLHVARVMLHVDVV